LKRRLTGTVLKICYGAKNLCPFRLKEGFPKSNTFRNAVAHLLLFFLN
jgi:hypothetical protein